MSGGPRISLVFTVLNEGRSLPALLAGIAAQTRPADEIVVCDGGSSDDTVAQLEAAAASLPLRVLVEPGANIARGRNVAIAAARGVIIACTDAGVRLEPDWLERITQRLVNDGGISAVAGFFVADPQSTFEVAMSATVLPQLDEIKPADFLPSSRSVAFRKTAWASAGGYPEWLDYCEDLLFDFAIRACCGGFAFEPRAVTRFRPRGSLRAFVRQYYLYARGDGKADLWLKRHVVRYGTYLLALPILVVALGQGSPFAAVLLAVGAGAYLRRPYLRLPRVPGYAGLSTLERIKAAAWIPILRVTGDIAKMAGYPAGVYWRLSGARAAARRG